MTAAEAHATAEEEGLTLLRSAESVTGFRHVCPGGNASKSVAKSIAAGKLSP